MCGIFYSRIELSVKNITVILMLGNNYNTNMSLRQSQYKLENQ